MPENFRGVERSRRRLYIAVAVVITSAARCACAMLQRSTRATITTAAVTRRAVTWQVRSRAAVLPASPCPTTDDLASLCVSIGAVVISQYSSTIHAGCIAVAGVDRASGVLLKIEVGIRKGAWQRD